MHSPEPLSAQLPRGEGWLGCWVSKQGLENNRLPEFPECQDLHPTPAGGHHPRLSRHSNRRVHFPNSPSLQQRSFLQLRRDLRRRHHNPSPSAGGTSDSWPPGPRGWQDLSIFCLRKQHKMVARAVHPTRPIRIPDTQ